MKPTLALDQFSINGIPSDIEAMHAAFPQGWYQLTKGMQVNVMARRAWPVYSKYYGPYHFFQAVPDDGNWFYQDWMVYAEECARLFVLVTNGLLGGTDGMVDVEGGSLIPDSLLPKLFPNQTLAQQRASGYALLLRMLKLFCDTYETLTGKLLVIYTGKSFWEMIGGASASWAARHPLCLAVYPYDNYTDPAQYIAAIKKIMTGTQSLPVVEIPKPWIQANYVQFTGRAPVALIPGYALESNWAKTVDMSLVLNSPQNQAPSAPGGVQQLYTAYSVSPGINLNVHVSPDGASKSLDYLVPATTVYIDPNTITNNYGHFQPTAQYPNGGWVYLTFLTKTGN